jgi:hypothetical protein
VDPNDFYIFPAGLGDRAQYVAADPAEAIDANPNRHDATP